MNGTEKQIKYAEFLRALTIEKLEQERDLQNPEHYRNKSRDNKTKAQLEKRDLMIAEMEKTIVAKNEIISVLSNFSGYAGNMIDCCKMRFFDYPKNTVAYKNYLAMAN